MIQESVVQRILGSILSGEANHPKPQPQKNATLGRRVRQNLAALLSQRSSRHMGKQVRPNAGRQLERVAHGDHTFATKQLIQATRSENLAHSTVDGPQGGGADERNLVNDQDLRSAKSRCICANSIGLAGGCSTRS
jgi:hypothetical protein